MNKYIARAYEVATKNNNKNKTGKKNTMSHDEASRIIKAINNMVCY